MWEGVTVQRVSYDGEVYRLSTSEQELEADQVIVVTGSYHIPKRHLLAHQLPASILQLDARDYRSPASLPAGPVLVVGSGQSGCQVAEDLFLNLDQADAVYCRIQSNIDAWIAQQGIQAPEEPAYVPCGSPHQGKIPVWTSASTPWRR